MANVLKMAKVHSIQTLHARGWSQRRIARELGVHRETVARYVQLARHRPRAGPDSVGLSRGGSGGIPLGGIGHRPVTPGGSEEVVLRPKVPPGSGSRQNCDVLEA